MSGALTISREETMTTIPINQLASNTVTARIDTTPHAKRSYPTATEATLWAVWLAARVTGVGLLVRQTRRATEWTRTRAHRAALRLALDTCAAVARFSTWLIKQIGQFNGVQLDRRQVLTVGVLAALTGQLAGLLLFG